MEEWKEYKLGDVCTMIPGFAFKSKDFGIGKDIAIKIKDIRPPFVETKEADNVDTSNYNQKKLSKFVVHKGEFLLAMTGATIGKIGKYICEEPAYVNQRVLKFEDAGLILYDYLYYYLSTDVFQSFITNHIDSQSAQPNISSTTIGKYPIKVPSIKVQKQIASILKSLDDKIEVNRKINENLEQQAQALFKSWFVDFDPFKNGEFVESELGMIPKGWRVGKLSSFGKVICGKTPSKAESSYYGGDMPFIKIPDMHNKVFVEQSEDNLSRLGDESQSAKRIPPYSILVSCIATVGLVCINTKESHTNQQINTIIPDLPIFRYYLYQKLLSIKDYLINLGRGGTATLNVNTKTFGNIKIIKPQDDVLSEYEELVTPLFNKIERNQEQSRRLAELRDTLLPKLMSGELKVNEIEDVL